MMSNKNIHFARRYAKRETSKRDFRIVKTWSTPKESDSEPHSGPSSSGRKGYIPSSDPNSSDSNDVTYNPTESSELPTGSGQSTAPATTSETPGVLETETPDSEAPEIEKEKGTEEIETTPTETENVTETPYSSGTAEYLPRSTSQRSGSSREGSSSPASTNSSHTSESASKETLESTSKESSEASLSPKESSRKGSVKKKNNQERTSKESTNDGTNKNKWTVKNWKDVDILSEDQPLSPTLVSQDVGQENFQEVQATSDHEDFLAPPDLLHEPDDRSEDQGVLESEKLPKRHIGHEESPAPPELVHEPPADQPLQEDSSLSSSSPVGADEPPELERNETSDTNNASSLSTLSKTLSICLERVEVKQYQAKYDSDRIETSESPEKENYDKSYSDSEDKITSSQDSSRKPYKMKGRGPKSVQMKRKAAQKASVSDCDSSTVGQSSSFTEESTKDPHQVVSSSRKDPSVSPPEKEQESVDPQRIETDTDDKPTETPRGKKGSAGTKSKVRSTGKQKSTPKGKVEAAHKKSETVKRTATRKGNETPSRQSSPESGLASDAEETTRTQKKKSNTSLIKETPKKAKVTTKAKALKSQAKEQEPSDEEDSHSETEETTKQVVNQTGTRKEAKTSRLNSPESILASDVEETSRTRKKKSVTSIVKKTPKKGRVLKSKAAKSQDEEEESLSELEKLSGKEEAAKQPVKQTRRGTETKRRQSSPESRPESDGEETKSRKKKYVAPTTKETPKKAKVSTKTKVSTDIDEESLNDQEEDDLTEQEESTEQPVKQDGFRKSTESGLESDVEERTISGKKKSNVLVKELSKKNKASKAKASKANDANPSSMSEQDIFTEREDLTKQSAIVPAAKKQPEVMKRPNMTPSRSRTPSSSTHEEESSQSKRARLTPGEKVRGSTEQEAVEDSNDDAHSVASSLRMEGVDFEKTPQIESDVTKKPGASPSSLWKGKKISALKPRAWSPQRREHTSSAASDDMSMVSSIPTETKETKRAKPVKRSTAKKPKQINKKARAKARPRREVESDEEERYASRSVSVWSQSNQPRRGTDVLDLDIVLECLQSVEREMYEEADSRPCEKATQKVGSFVRKEIHKTISQVQEIKHSQSESKKLCSSVKDLRLDLQEKQVSKIKLNAQLKKLKTKSGIDDDLINLNSWLDDYDKLMSTWDKSKSTHSKQQKYRWIGDIPDDMKALL